MSKCGPSCWVYTWHNCLGFMHWRPKQNFVPFITAFVVALQGDLYSSFRISLHTSAFMPLNNKSSLDIGLKIWKKKRLAYLKRIEKKKKLTENSLCFHVALLQGSRFGISVAFFLLVIVALWPCLSSVPHCTYRLLLCITFCWRPTLWREFGSKGGHYILSIDMWTVGIAVCESRCPHSL